MRLSQLRLQDLRGFRNLDLDLDPGWNVFVGPNGAGKTSILEAAYVLSHARSFRGGPKDALVRRGATGFSVYGSIARTSASEIGVGLSRSAGVLEARIAGSVVSVAELLRQTAVACFEPGSHALISGPADERRRFLDWGVFHVEHDFLRVWRAYQRALKQRNSLLRSGTGLEGLDAWDVELARSGSALIEMRRHYAARWSPAAAAMLAELLAELGLASLSIDSGWAGEAEALEQIAASRAEDVRRGFTTRGPHRADWAITFEQAPRREHLSRGQEKLCALGCILAQARVFAQTRGEWPIVCIDDLASELDEPHQEQLVRTLAAAGAQILVTGTHEPAALRDGRIAPSRFHVEPGRVLRLL